MPLSQERGSKEEGIIRMDHATLELFNLLPVNSSTIARMFTSVTGYSKFTSSVVDLNFNFLPSSKIETSYLPLGDSNLDL